MAVGSRELDFTRRAEPHFPDLHPRHGIRIAPSRQDAQTLRPKLVQEAQAQAEPLMIDKTDDRAVRDERCCRTETRRPVKIQQPAWRKFQDPGVLEMRLEARFTVLLAFAGSSVPCL